MPLGLPDTLSRASLRRRAPFAWLTRGRSLALRHLFTERVWVYEIARSEPAVCYPSGVTTPETPPEQRGAGGTPGGVGQFFIGLTMAVVGVYLLLNQVQVTTSFWGVGRFGGFGPTLLPLLVGVGFLFYNGRSVVGWRPRNHPGRRPDEHGHLLPSDDAVQHDRDAWTLVRGTRSDRPLTSRRVDGFGGSTQIVPAAGSGLIRIN